MFWLPLPVIPFLPLPAEVRVGLGAGMLVAAEIVFWAGAALAGPRAVQQLKGWWRRRLPGAWGASVQANQAESGSPVSIGSDSSSDHSLRDPS